MRSVCFFGIYDPGYARNRVLMQGFRENGWKVLECRADPRAFPGWRKYRELYRQYRGIRNEHPDLIVVAFPGHTVVPFARLLFGRRFLFDAFLSLYDSNVLDRAVHPPRSILAGLDWFWDWLSVRLAWRVLLDTDAHIEYFVRSFSARREKMLRVWISADDKVFHPLSNIPSDRFTVHFHGTFIPLQGIQYILEAAHMLRDEPIRFRIVGKGQESEAMEQKVRDLALTNVKFVGAAPFEAIPGYIASAQITLGIFGDTEKTRRVIPNKVFEQLAMGSAIITADTPAIRELECFGELPLVLVPAADPAALSVAIRHLLREETERARIALQAGAFFHAYLRPRIVVSELVERLGEHV